MSETVENTSGNFISPLRQEKYPNLIRLQPGQSGNPKGRPKGAKQEFGEAFVKALHEDFAVNGPEVIVKVRTSDPATYLKVCAQICPREITVNATDSDLTDEQALERIRQLDSVIERALGANNATRGQPEQEPAGPVQTLQ